MAYVKLQGGRVRRACERRLESIKLARAREREEQITRLTGRRFFSHTREEAEREVDGEAFHEFLYRRQEERVRDVLAAAKVSEEVTLTGEDVRDLEEFL